MSDHRAPLHAHVQSFNWLQFCSVTETQRKRYRTLNDSFMITEDMKFPVIKAMLKFEK